MKLHTIAVVIPAYNCSGTLARALNSVFSQSVLPDQIIIVDDGSTDNTYSLALDIAQFYRGDDSIKVLTQENQGSAVARQVGSDATDCEYIAYLDADDWWSPEKLAQVHEIINAHRIEFLFSDLVRIHDDNPLKELPGNSTNFPWAISFIEERSTPFGDGLFGLFKFNATALLLKGFPAFPSTYVVKKSALNVVGGWNSRFRRCQDFDLALRLTYKFGCYYVDRSMAYMGINSTAHDTSKYFIKQTLGDIEVLKYHFEKNSFPYHYMGERIAERYCTLGYALRESGQKRAAIAAYLGAMFWPGKRVHALIRMLTVWL